MLYLMYVYRQSGREKVDRYQSRMSPAVGFCADGTESMQACAPSVYSVVDI
jgi:hypothetical protein